MSATAEFVGYDRSSTPTDYADLRQCFTGAAALTGRPRVCPSGSCTPSSARTKRPPRRTTFSRNLLDPSSRYSGAPRRPTAGR